MYLPVNADCLGETILLAQLRQIRYSPSRRSSVMQLLQNSCLHRWQRVSCGGSTVRLHRLHWLSGSGGRVPPIGIIMSRTEANAQLSVTKESKINLTKQGWETGKNTVFNNVPLLVFKYEMVRGVGFEPTNPYGTGS